MFECLISLGSLHFSEQYIFPGSISPPIRLHVGHSPRTKIPMFIPCSKDLGEQLPDAIFHILL